MPRKKVAKNTAERYLRALLVETIWMPPLWIPPWPSAFAVSMLRVKKKPRGSVLEADDVVTVRHKLAHCFRVEEADVHRLARADRTAERVFFSISRSMPTANAEDPRPSERT